jgi:hypothetical protein
MPMDSWRFCLWLDEVLPDDARALTAEETAAIRGTLSEVFVHEIDPALGDEAHQARLRGVHGGGGAGGGRDRPMGRATAPKTEA